LVKKKDGTSRAVIDFRRLNAQIRPAFYPLPEIKDVFESLGQGGLKYVSSLDLKSGYYQCLLEPGSRDKTAFTNHLGLFQFRALPMGICTAPAGFMALINHVFRGLTYKYV